MTEFWQQEMAKTVDELETPMVLVHRAKLEQNVREMAEFAREHGVRLRPHLKTHKTWEIAELQLAAGAVGLTCAKLGEATVFLERGARDVLVAYPLVGPKIRRLFELMAQYPQAVLQTLTAELAHAQALSEAAVAQGVQLKVWLKVDSGLKRVGVEPGERAAQLFREMAQLPGLDVQGFLTHAGHAYGAQTPEQVRAIGEYEAHCLLETMALVQSQGEIQSQKQNASSLAVSVGSTPTVRISGAVSGVTEIRPGNYVFCDATQIRLGVVRPERVSLRVLSRVVSRPAGDRIVIDAGAKTLALDRGAHGSDALQGYGLIVGHEHAVIERLSEEHGVVRIPTDSHIRVGDVLEIIPNHSCPVANLTDHLTVLNHDGSLSVWSVIARGQTI
ncbi:alanine racemase [Tumebacillus sp. ITR2]|uniref:Alanine racemase n=1 Tax=Tumebacillus amylolyticus TaxID=2801339 RepID=A0ABS1J7Z9_9BACL|nr:alanine racemase [Tumebacillus amylolyticus]MBL0386401.1 alanine racemase [Tumebacillus amylolyticus]